MISTRQARRRTVGGLGPETTALLLFLAVMVLVMLAWAALSAGSWCAGLPVTRHPVVALLQVAIGQHPWPWQSSVVAAVFAAPVGVLVRMGWRSMGSRPRIDAAARTMHRPSEITMATQAANAAAATRLLRDAPPEIRALKGPPLGATVQGGIELYVPAEMGVVIAAGQRTGKTMVWAVPAVLAGWGPVLATSNKPDVYRHTVGGREEQGSRIWLCDLQAVTGTVQCSFWVDLLAQVQTLPAARKLGGFFIADSNAENARVDAYFDGGARELLALYIFAAACAGGDLIHAAEWLGRDQDQTPVLILRDHDHPRAAERILEAQSLYARQRDGLFDMARRYLNVLTHEGYARMVTPPQRRIIKAHEGPDNTVVLDISDGEEVHDLPQFQPREFVTSNDTLYALSMAGHDSATPLTAALIGQILEAALTASRARADGRLAVPLLAVLDEAANCARIAELPEYYTYCAGCGIILITILQVLEQGEALWGANGLKIMRAQAIEVYGGGIAALDYLEHWSRMTGPHDVAERSRSYGPGGVTRSLTWRSEPILDVAQLGALPKDRAVIRLPNHGPLLVKKVPWYHNPDLAPQIERSLARFKDPTAETVIPPTTGTTDPSAGSAT
ncbi:type IV secretory system conjugative DNA transfer family protein [Nocardia sp. NPDC050408]|uniref:type IV secretory system conjugative DNA transfer family protein n=1 Tax=Nocardia sp. NPDC050408 TaxID=3364319 RepID=UPI00378C9D02